MQVVGVEGGEGGAHLGNFQELSFCRVICSLRLYGTCQHREYYREELNSQMNVDLRLASSLRLVVYS